MTDLPGHWLSDPYILALTGAGLLVALVVRLPLALRRLPLSLPIVCIAIGAALSKAPWAAIARIADLVTPADAQKLV